MFLFGLFTAIAFWPSFINIASTVPSTSDDTFYFLWGIWWVNFASFTLHASPLITKMLFYPIGANMVTWPLPFLESFLTLPIQRLSVPAAYNISLLLAFVLSGIFAYALVKRLTKDRYAAFIGGMIYAFSPIHVAHAFAGHLNWVNVEFLPLLLLCILLLLREKKYRYSFYAAVCLLLITLFGDFEQSMLSAILVLVLLYFYAFYYGFKKNFTKKVIASLLLIPLIALLLGWPYLSQVLYLLGHSDALQTLHSNTLAISWSDSALGFLLPSYYNPLYNPILSGGSPNFLGNLYTLMYNGNVIVPNTQAVTQDERTSYMGYPVLLLFVAGIYYDRKKKGKAGTVFWLNIFIFFYLMSLGPLLRLLNSIAGIPGPYILYAIVPFVNIIREAGRFYFAATIPLAIIASVGISELYKKFGLRRNRQKLLATALISLLIFIDYFGFVLPGHTQLLFENATVPAGYLAIRGYQPNTSVLMLPALGNGNYQEHEAYYQSAFEKPLFNGYGKMNLSQAEHTSLLPVSAYAFNLEGSGSGAFASPVNESQELLSYAILKSNNVSYVGVVKQAYNGSSAGKLDAYLRSLLGSPVYNDSSTEIFSTKFIPQNQLMFNPDGTWVSGSLFCAYYGISACNTSFSTGWWGSTRRNITIYAPSGSILNISFSAKSFNQSSAGTVYLYLNSNAQPLGQFPINVNQTPERFQLRLSKGINQLEFSTRQPARRENYLTYDIHNLTVGR